MVFTCPKCGQDVALGDARCKNPECGLGLSLGSLTRYYAGLFWQGLTKGLSPICPNCKTENPLRTAQCQRCGFELSVTNTFGFYLRPLRERYERLRPNDPATRRNMQLLYLLGSLALLAIAVLVVDHKVGNDWRNWLTPLLISLAYCAFCTLFFLVVVPRHVLFVIRTRAAPMTKLSLLANLFTAVLFLQVIVGTWQKRALVLLTSFGVFLAALFLFQLIIYPIWRGMNPPPPPEDLPEQGRAVKRDYWNV